MDMCATSSSITASCRRRQQLMRRVIINASCLLIICTAASAVSEGSRVNAEGDGSRTVTIPGIISIGTTPDNKQPRNHSTYNSMMNRRDFVVHIEDEMLSTAKSDNDIRKMEREHLFRSNVARWKRSSSYSTGRNSTNKNFNILNLSNKNLSDTRRLTQEISNYIQKRSKYEIGHYYNISDIGALDLSKNNLSGVLPLQLQRNFSILTWLDLSENNLSSTGPLSDEMMLQYLNLSFNRLTAFDSSNLPHLTRLDLSSNAIANISLLSPLVLPNLTELNLACNQLQTIGKSFFFFTRSLHRLDISGNGINRLNQSIFNNLINLEHLNLARNQIDVIENDTFSYLVNLQFLDLSHNNIDPGSIRALQGIPALIGLSLAYNEQLGPVMHEFVASWSLKELDASGIGLCHIPTALAQSVKSLKLASNLLSVIRSGDFESYPLLQQLILSNNLILDVEDDALGRLELLSTLYLDKNRLVRVPVSLPSNLNHLHLQHNAIYELQPVAFKNLKNLKTLNLEGNKIAYLPELPLPGLAVLNVRSNDLKGLSQSVVKTSPNLRDFLLENNPVKCADLLGIAEWAKPCRDEMLFNDDQNYHRIGNINDDDSGDNFDFFPSFTTGLKKCNRGESSPLLGYTVLPADIATKMALFKSQCKSENLINPKLLKHENIPKKHLLWNATIAPGITITKSTEASINTSHTVYDTFTIIDMMNTQRDHFDAKVSLLKNSTMNVVADARLGNSSKLRSEKKSSSNNITSTTISNAPALVNNRFANENKLNKSFTHNKVVSLLTETPLINIIVNQPGDASNESVTIEKKLSLAVTDIKMEKLSGDNLIKTVVATTKIHPIEQMTTASEKLLEITLPSEVSSTISSSSPVMVGKYEQTTPTPVLRPNVLQTLAPTNSLIRLSGSDHIINNKNKSNWNHDVLTNDSAKEGLKQIILHRQKIARKNTSYNTKIRKNVNHMKMKLKFDHDNNEFRDNFDIDSVLDYGNGHTDRDMAHRKPRKFSIYDSIYIASLKNTNFKPALHHSVHVPLTSQPTSTHADSISSAQHRIIPATSGETSSKILPQEWNDVRPESSSGSHYGVFIVVGATLGMLISFGLFHLYYCRVRLRRGQHLHGHNYNYQQAPDHYQRARCGENSSSSHNSAHHRYSYASEQDDSDERLTYAISTSVLDAPDEGGVNSPMQTDVLSMDVLNPVKSKPLSRHSSTSSSDSSSSRNSASCCIGGVVTNDLQQINSYDKHIHGSSNRQNGSNNHIRQNRSNALVSMNGRNAIGRW